MEKAPLPNPDSDEKVVDGVTYRRVNNGSLRKFFSHSGSGWDYRWPILDKYGVDEPAELPDEPYYTWEEVADENK